MIAVHRFIGTLPFVTAALLALAAAPAVAAPSATVTTEQVRAELVADAPQGIAAGRPLRLGLLLQHQPHWHSYWKNPGDSGLPTTLQWQLPAGFAAGDIAWPVPQRLRIGPLANYGFEGTLLLPVEVTVPAGFAAPQLDVRLRAEWLVCKEVCIPQGGEFALAVPAQAATAGHAALFAAAARAVPQPLAADAKVQAQVDGQALTLRVPGLPAAWRGQPLELFGEMAGVIDHAARIDGRWDGDDWQAAVPLSNYRYESPARMAAVLKLAAASPPSAAAALPGLPAVQRAPAAPADVAGVRVEFDIDGAWPPLPAAAASQPAPAGVEAPVAAGAGAAGAVAPTSASASASASPLGFGAALLLAFAGGLLLNLMPCVFPVLSLKLLGFAAHAHDRRARLAGALAYSAGVVLSFLALAALLLGLRAGGEQLGWGFQLQSPGFVAALAALFTLIGLNLAGVFEVGMLLPSRLATLRARHPVADSLLTGVVAVAVASPCTAPFMGASLGLALTLAPAAALAVFAALGIGMALPYGLAALWPGLAQRLPRPGPWMARLRALLAFPMFATVIWLAWVFGQQAGIDALAALLALLLALAFAAWAWAAPGFGRAARLGIGGVAAALLVGALAWTLPLLRTDPEAAQAARRTAPAASKDAVSSATAGWQPWSTERVQALVAQGRPVFVDFTAAWCVTCQFNKRVLHDEAQQRAFAERGVALLRADWTRRDAAIAAELTRLGRSGVPVYALYTPRGGMQPQLLPELLSASALTQALAALPGS